MLLLVLILMSVVGFVAVVGVGILILYACAFVALHTPRWLRWLKGPFIAFVLLLAAGWLAPVASFIHPSGPWIAIVTVVLGVIGGDLWHTWRGKPATYQPLQQGMASFRVDENEDDV